MPYQCPQITWEQFLLGMVGVSKKKSIQEQGILPLCAYFNASLTSAFVLMPIIIAVQCSAVQCSAVQCLYTIVTIIFLRNRW